MEKLIEMCSLNSVSGNEFKMTNYIKEYTKNNNGERRKRVEI